MKVFNIRLLGALALAGVASSTQAQTPPEFEVLASVDGEAISSEDVSRSLGARLAKLEEQIYKLKMRRLEELIVEKLLANEAARRGVTVNALLEDEVTAKTSPVTDDDVRNFFQSTKDFLDADETVVRENVRTKLRMDKIAARRETFLQELRSHADVAVFLRAPQPFRAQLRVEGAPVRGPSTAPITIVEFEDFQCPFCHQIQATLEQLLHLYGDKVRVVHRDFPIDRLHPKARLAHEAARCAGAQGRFWEFHDALHETDATSVEAHASIATRLSLDEAAFGSCVANREFRESVQEDLDEGSRLGVTGTPALFINGRFLSGAQPLHKLVEVIDEELAALP